MTIIGYRNEVYGDETTECIEVHQLDDDELLIQALLAKIEPELAMLERRRYEPALKLKPSEIGRLAELEAMEQEVKSNCRHRVFLDEGGFGPYTRTCQVCGSFMGTV
jgi:hypothetical protein